MCEDVFKLHYWTMIISDVKVIFHLIAYFASRKKGLKRNRLVFVDRTIMAARGQILFFFFHFWQFIVYRDENYLHFI